MAVMRHRDILVHHPYDSFATSVERFVAQAVEDPNVLAIKQTVYRTSDDSPLVPALIRGLRARQAGGVPGGAQGAVRRAGQHPVGESPGRSGRARGLRHPSLKTHAKCVLVVRREGDGVRHYVHIGTGNYHATHRAPVHGLRPVHLRRADRADVADMFNYLTGYARPRRYRQVLVAPLHLRTGILDEIDRAIAAQQEWHGPRASR